MKMGISILKIENENISVVRDQAVELLNKVFLGEAKFSEKLWRWKYEENTVGGPFGYAAFYESKLIGLRMIWQTLCFDSGTPVKIFQPTDSAVCQRFRGHGVFSRMNMKFIEDMQIERPNVLVMNFPNNNSINTYLKLGWSEVVKRRWVVRPIVPIPRKKMGYLTEIDTSTKSCQPFDSEFFQWRFSKRPDKKYVIFSKNCCSAIFSTQYFKKLKAARCVFSDFTLGNMDVFREMIEELQAHGYVALIALEEESSFSKLMKKSFVCLYSKNSLSIVTNESLSVCPAVKQVQPCLCDNF